MTTKNSKKILIVDDHEETRETYVNLFKRGGFEVIEAKDGIEGLDRATSEEGIDAIFTGIVMPRMDGFQMIEALKKNTATSGIPVFMNSHLGREDDREKALDMGLKDFIVRGMTPPSEIVKKILYQIGNRSYMIKVDPFEMDGQQLIQDLNLPDDLICDNCGSGLSIKLNYQNEEDGFHAKLTCPSCNKRF
jgi:CheY-like chemotaxis protein